MKTKQIASLQDRLEIYLRREPFRPFAVSLDDGKQVAFRTERELGAPHRMGYFYYFHPQGGVLEINRDAVRVLIDLPTGKKQT